MFLMGRHPAQAARLLRKADPRRSAVDNDAVIVRGQGAERGENLLKRVRLEDGLRHGVDVVQDRDDHVAQFLAGSGAQGAAHGLHDGSN